LTARAVLLISAALAAVWQPDAPTGARAPAADHWGGDVAQLGERLVRNEEVVGSIPIISTISSRVLGQAQRNPDL
jgi:hypothetical protein